MYHDCVCVYVDKNTAIYTNMLLVKKSLGGENTVFEISFLCYLCFLIFYNSYAAFIKIKLFYILKGFRQSYHILRNCLIKTELPIPRWLSFIHFLFIFLFLFPMQEKGTFKVETRNFFLFTHKTTLTNWKRKTKEL